MSATGSTLTRWLKWEFWPFWLFYGPVYLKILADGLRSGTLSYFTAVNPGMRTGGFSGYSKYDILQQLQHRFRPCTFRFTEKPQALDITGKMKEAGLSFPIILKPDLGERGWQVEKINNETELHAYLKDAQVPLLLQEFIPFEEEYGIMYYRLPGHRHGTITSMMKREFLTVTGNGHSTLLQLFEQHERCRYHLKRFTKKFSHRLNGVLAYGEKLVLEEIGNHNRGTTFLDAKHLINDRLVSVFDEVAGSLQEWYFGRFDVRTPSYSELLNGNFRILEVNGVNSEPAHIYDPHMSLRKAYSDLFAHWSAIYRISKANRKRGFKPDKAADLVQMVRMHLKQKKDHPGNQVMNETGQADF